MKKLRGTSRPDRDPPGEPRPAIDEALAPPVPLRVKAARELWARSVAEALRLGLLTTVDRAALAAYCMAWGDVAEADARQHKDGLILKDGRLNPAVRAKNAALDKLIRLATEFGFTPASRPRLGRSAVLKDPQPDGATKPEPVRGSLAELLERRTALH